jgi:hypothetical protein
MSFFGVDGTKVGESICGTMRISAQFLTLTIEVVDFNVTVYENIVRVFYRECEGKDYVTRWLPIESLIEIDFREKSKS